MEINLAGNKWRDSRKSWRKYFSLSLSPSSLKSTWYFILSSMLRIIDKNNPTTRNFYGDRIFDVVDFIYLESFSKYLGTFGI